jgi:hypothetical protein
MRRTVLGAWRLPSSLGVHGAIEQLAYVRFPGSDNADRRFATWPEHKPTLKAPYHSFGFRKGFG